MKRLILLELLGTNISTLGSPYLGEGKPPIRPR